MTATISNGVSASYSPAEDELGAADPTALLAESGDLKPLAERTYTNPVPYADGKSHTAPDPFVLKYRDLYYCYATTSTAFWSPPHRTWCTGPHMDSATPKPDAETSGPHR
ncbi:hypothetical protein [Bifidobacterium longum]|uniref:hypothetical protein n=1 Tax=Bifidobacterium longum TaxID=216816 RepID=UPI000ADD1982|nr:hypothetical protein [Bifidobacterium longum]